GHGRRPWPTFYHVPPDCSDGIVSGVVPSPSASPSATYQVTRRIDFRVGWTRPQAVANIPPRTTGLLCWCCIRRCPVALGFAEANIPLNPSDPFSPQQNGATPTGSVNCPPQFTGTRSRPAGQHKGLE